jgi:ribosomal protein S18 acetylase RimI-like enzyme
MTIRPYCDAEDRAAVMALWRHGFGDQRGHNDAGLVIDLKLAADDGLFFVGVEGVVVGTVMAGYDGHRGWIYRLTVALDLRDRGHGAALVRHAEGVLAGRGCPKVNLQVVATNAGVVGFYESLGYAVEPRISMGKCLPAQGWGGS